MRMRIIAAALILLPILLTICCLSAGSIHMLPAAVKKGAPRGGEMGRSRRADCGRPRSFRRALRAMLAIVAVALSLSACGRVPAASISPSG